MGFHNLEQIFDQVGHFGRFQIFLYFICAYQNVSCGIHYSSSVFISYTPEHTCKPPGAVRMAVFQNVSSWRLEDVLALLSPGQKNHIAVELQDGEIWELSKCSRVWRQNMSHLDYEYSGYKHIIPCSDGYIFDQSNWETTAVTTWNLVCDRKQYANAIQPFFMFGVLLGAIIFGILSDRIGRRLVLWCTSIGIFLFGIISLFTFDYYSFMASRFFLAATASGYHVVVFIYVMEFIGVRFRTWASIHLHSFFAIGTMIVALIGYMVKTLWIYQMILSTVTIPFILCCWILPETPFWLLSKGKYREAQFVVDIMAEGNQSTPCDLSELLSLDLNSPASKSSSVIKKQNLIDLFFNWNMASRTLILWIIWFTCSLGFYSFSLDALTSVTNESLQLFLLGSVEIAAYFFLAIMLDRVGRRNILVWSFLCIVLVCGTIMVIPQDAKAWKLAIVMIGKFAIGSAFGLIYLYTAELYPTTLRSNAVGSGSMVCRVVSIMSPLSKEISRVWILVPQLFLGIMTLLSILLTLQLPETLGKPLVTTWKEIEQLEAKKKSLSTINNTSLEKTESNDTGPGKTETTDLEDSTADDE